MRVRRRGMRFALAAFGTVIVSSVLYAFAPAAASAGPAYGLGFSSPTVGHSYRHGAVPHIVKVPISGSGTASPTTGTVVTRPGYPTKGPLHYGGGPVVTGQPKVYLVFWGSQWGTESTVGGYETFSGDPDGLAPYAQAYYKGLGTNNELWSAIATQYCQGIATGATSCPVSPSTQNVAYPNSGGVLAGVWEDTSYTPPTGPAGDHTTPGATAVMLAQEAANAAIQFGDSSIEAQYIILSPTGTNPDGWLDPKTGYCAYHGYTQDPYFNGAVSGPSVTYSNLPYAPDVNATGSCSSFTSPGVLDGMGEDINHEYAETLTDPYPGQGWTDAKGNEIADKCDYLLPTQPGSAIYLQLATGAFDAQGIWANSANKGHGGCETAQSPILLGPVTKVQRAHLGLPITPVSISATDGIPGSVLSYQSVALPAGLGVDPGTGLITGTPTAKGRTAVVIDISDGTNVGSVSFTWVVTK